MSKKIVITGGAGFIGVNSARYFAEQGWQVIVVDNLSRTGTDLNLKWLQDEVSSSDEQEIIFSLNDIRQ